MKIKIDIKIKTGKSMILITKSKKRFITLKKKLVSSSNILSSAIFIPIQDTITNQI